jgi:peptidoglycan hydrolase FlgJ
MQISPLFPSRIPDPTARKAQEFEATFLAEMLRHAGSGPMAGAFGGGLGEAQFHSLLVRAQADAIVSAGGLGLADQIAQRMAPDVDG